ncbi:alh-11, partial [Pristionchus pacificus]
DSGMSTEEASSGATRASVSAPCAPDARQWLLGGAAAEGDLLFFGRLPESTTGDFEGAVLSVGAKHERGKGLFHVGIVARRVEDGASEKEHGALCVVHAAQKGVLAQTLQETLAEIEPDEIQVYTVDVDEAKKKAATRFAVSKIGCTYNDIFSKECRDSAGAEAYYCSQLITESYKGVHVGFPPHKMTFGAKDGEVADYWKEYYRQRKCAVPVGEEGSHPGKLVEAERLRLTMSVRVTSSSKLASSLANRAALLARPHWIGGTAVELQGGAEFDVVQPRSGAVVARCAGATRAQTAAAIGAARAAQPAWAARPWLARGEVLRKTAQLIREHLEPLALAECEDNGKPIYEARADVASCAETFDFYAGVGASLAGAHFPLDSSRFAYTRREPVGVVGCVGAWNYPLQTCSWKTAPALAAGNSVVYKPSPLSPLTARLLGELLQEAGLPDGVYNVVQGEGETGAALVESPEVNKVSFTGSIPTGKRIMQACAARSIKPLTLELGGKSSLIILEDADVDSAVAGAMMANFFSQGQVCSNASKVLVHRSIVDVFTERLIAKTAKMKVGDPLDESTRVGAAISREHMDKVRAYIDGAVAAGARLLYGGRRVTVAGLEGGFYLEPAILSAITESMAVYKEEIFGSVLLVIPFDEESEALGMANDTDMGLAAGVFTKNLSKAHNLAARLHAGNVYVNTYNDVSPFVPFGGYGQSGFGRENGVAALEHYTQTKSVFVNTDEKLTNPFE